jgi:NADH-quinone oxidoreductase subunit E
MSRHTQGSLAIVGAIAGAVFLVAFVAMYVLSDYSISAAVFLALLPAAAAAVVLYRGFADGAQTARPAAPVAAPAPKPAPVAAEAEAAPAPVAAAAGGKPAGLDGPREGGADDLKKIKGVGPKLEKLLNSMGYWHFDQIAAWGESDVAWVDENLEGFKGRVSRDNWVSQASTLASGGETEFSKRA